MDRNGEIIVPSPAVMVSLSARRAWIEMGGRGTGKTYGALSLSARRAWIEISKIIMLVLGLEKVALRKESVDRNSLLAGLLVAL